MQRDAGDQFHYQEIDSVFTAKLVDRLNIGMVQFAKSQGLAAETLARSFVGERAAIQHFQRNVALQLFVMSAIHHAHAAGTDLGDDAIMRNGLIEHAGSYACPNWLLLIWTGTKTVSRALSIDES